MHSKFTLTYIFKDAHEVTLISQTDTIVFGFHPPSSDEVDPRGVDLLRVKARNKSAKAQMEKTVDMLDRQH